ncbi:LysR family transcriptional regulator [Advenella kashmirensis W13003]|uniref:LysR family transcriptional regulator n=2 Tax=Advenella kashmirensis TaxID=310575 RepID=V8QVL6_9BURK|nr:LysR family transcriptional regulator [Advenella kashmirensis W13003]
MIYSHNLHIINGMDNSPSHLKNPYPALRRLSLSLLLTFDSLMQTLSVTESAQRLHKSQPAVSRELGRLRDLLNDPLFVVVKKRLVPTERALALHRASHQALAALEAAAGSGQPFNPASLTGVISIGAAAHIELLLAAPLTLALQKAAPHLTVRFQPVHGDFVPDDLDSDTMDLAIGLFQTPGSKFRHWMLFEDERVCVVSSAHPLSRHDELTLDDLGKIKWLAFSHMYGQQTNFTRALDDIDSHMPFTAYVSNFGMAPHFLLESDYATTMPKRIAEKYQRYFDLTQIRLPEVLRHASMKMVWSEKNEYSKLNQWLRNTTQAIIADIVAS